MEIKATPEELYLVIGELEFIRRKLIQRAQEFLTQIDEMSAEITRLREEKSGRLDKTDSNK